MRGRHGTVYQCPLLGSALCPLSSGACPWTQNSSQVFLQRWPCESTTWMVTHLFQRGCPKKDFCFRVKRIISITCPISLFRSDRWQHSQHPHLSLSPPTPCGMSPSRDSSCTVDPRGGPSSTFPAAFSLSADAQGLWYMVCMGSNPLQHCRSLVSQNPFLLTSNLVSALKAKLSFRNVNLVNSHPRSKPLNPNSPVWPWKACTIRSHVSCSPSLCVSSELMLHVTSLGPSYRPLSHPPPGPHSSCFLHWEHNPHIPKSHGTFWVCCIDLSSPLSLGSLVSLDVPCTNSPKRCISSTIVLYQTIQIAWTRIPMKKQGQPWQAVVILDWRKWLYAQASVRLIFPTCTAIMSVFDS